jgi:hypothetical protein
MTLARIMRAASHRARRSMRPERLPRGADALARDAEDLKVRRSRRAAFLAASRLSVVIGARLPALSPRVCLSR